METISNNDLAKQAVRKINDNFAELAQGESGGGGSDDTAVIETTKHKLFIGSIVSGKPVFSDNQAQISQDGSRVSMRSMVCFPKRNTTYHFKLPKNIGCELYTSSNLGTGIALDTSLGNNGIITNEYDYEHTTIFYYCAAFLYVNNGVATGASLTTGTIQEMIANGEIEITYEDNDPDVIARNTDKESLIFACRRHYVGIGSTTGLTDNYWACFGHISDIHGDVQRFDNFMRYCDYLEVDGAINTGDSNVNDYSNGSWFIDDVAQNYKSRLSYITGNHEVQKGNESKCIAMCVTPYKTRYNYLHDSKTITNNLWWYQDVVKDATSGSKRNIRIIHVCIHAGCIYLGVNKSPGGLYTQAQLEWLVATLSSTPNGYGVIILMHSSETAVVKDTKSGKFYSEQTRYNDLKPNSTSVRGSYVDVNRPIRSIVDAFIGRENISGGLTVNEARVIEPYTINVDFSGFSGNSNAPEFICYCTGHYHRDYIGYVEGATYKQLMLCIANGNAHRNSEEDFPRGTVGAVQDLFNIYVINRDKGEVNVIRVGSNITSDMQVRDYMSIPYKD